jgi:7-keto-8-aminopelargonate synthetase-like enzyme
LYDSLEAKLSTLFGGHALVTSSTTLAHQIALPVLVTEKDAIVLDHQVHYSVHMGATLARAGGARVDIVRHNQLEDAVEVVQRLARTSRTVWFATDGVFSMYGDLAPLGLLRKLLEVAPNVRLYVDDAHGMSWAGQHGRGSFLSRMRQDERIVVVTSLNKAFSASGGCLVFPTKDEREQVRITGGPMVFSGPLQPPMLGAAVAAADVHLSSEIEGLQAELRDRVDHCNALSQDMELPLLVKNEAPIFFFALGLPRVAMAVAERMRADGVYVNVSMYPSVPMRRAGIRMAVTSAHTRADITRCLEGLAKHGPAVLREERMSRRELDELFVRAVPEEARVSEVYVRGAEAIANFAAASATPMLTLYNTRRPGTRKRPNDLVLEHHTC